MTNVQLYLSIGIPSVLVVLAWIHSISRINRLETTTDEGFKQLAALRDIVYRQMIDVHERVARVEERTK